MSGISTGVETVRVGTGFSEPDFLTYAPTDPDKVFVVEKSGTIKILDPSSGNATSFLRVENINTANESGLLGLAFHPDYATNGKFYVDLINAVGHTEIRQYSVSARPDLADPTSGQVILTIEEPAFPNHKAGWIAFGPDKNLYIATGDGGGSYDPDNNAQKPGSLLGKILRISVNPSGTGPSYTVPADNPFVSASGYAPEIWAYGLRNPYRNSFDRQTGDLFIADVGQNLREEVNFQPASFNGGANYGWDLREGTIETPVGGGSLPGAIDPIYDYGHGLGPFQGYVVIGGYVYRGMLAPQLHGQYFFGDYLLAYVPIAGLIRRVLDERPSHRAPFSRFSEQIADFLPDQAADETIRTVINWGRYAEVFAYDEATGQFSLENPS
jgi:glucose/arabinose dehydrogenase